MKKVLAVVLAIIMGLSLCACGEETYPSRDINGSIMWSAGGVCDTTSRAIATYAEKELGVSFVMTNRAGGGGSVSTAYVNEQAADGYEVLFGAENPQIAKVMGTSEIDYDEFTPICIFCTSVAVLIVNKDSKFNTVEELFTALKSETLNEGSTGAGGLPYTVGAMVQSINGVSGNDVIYGGEADAITALMGGEVDYFITTLGSAMKYIQSGDVKALALFSEEKVQGVEDVPLITDVYAEYKDVLPWGPFYGVFVKNGTPDDVVSKLTTAFKAAAENKEFKDLIYGYGCVPTAMTGTEARTYVDSYKATTSYLIYDAGGTTIDPASLGIKRP